MAASGLAPSIHVAAVARVSIYERAAQQQVAQRAQVSLGGRMCVRASHAAPQAQSGGASAPYHVE